MKSIEEMKNKFEEAISDNVEALNEGSICGVNKAAKVCNTLHQQAKKEKVKEILQDIQEAIYSKKIMNYVIRKIAQANDIEL